MGERPSVIGEHGIHEDVLWSCTTCRACVYECPLFIEHVDDIIDMRRALVLMEGSMPEQLGQAFNLAQRSGNPWGNPAADRMKWAEGLDAPLLRNKKQTDVLYWIGCAGAYDPASQKTARAVVKILRQAGVDFAVLGDEEKCNCEWARRAGEENLYQTQTASNIGTFEKYEFNTIITHCPHCFNTFKNEYPDFGGSYPVLHHSQYIAQLIEEGKVKPGAGSTETITYHDSCYLGRYNDEYDSPRKSLEAIGGVQLVEMKRSRDRGLCCGGGGAQVWFENEAQKRPVGEVRLEEAMALQPDTVATACPFCTLMLSSAAQSQGVTDKVKIRDFAEIVAETL
jgi:Fe-S oxidoreductase